MLRETLLMEIPCLVLVVSSSF